jgi:hypothetical protein
LPTSLKVWEEFNDALMHSFKMPLNLHTSDELFRIDRMLYYGTIPICYNSYSSTRTGPQLRTRRTRKTHSSYPDYSPRPRGQAHPSHSQNFNTKNSQLNDQNIAHAHKDTNHCATIIILPKWKQTPYLARSLPTNYAQQFFTIPHTDTKQTNGNKNAASSYTS